MADYKKTSQELKKILAMRKRPVLSPFVATKAKRDPSFLERINPKKPEVKKKAWEEYRSPIKVHEKDSPYDIAAKLHELPDGILDKRLFGLDEEEMFVRFLRRIQREKLIDISHIGNVQTFLFNRTKYAMHEMMHGGSSGGSSFSLQTPTGTVNGVNATFIFTTAPSVIVVDQGRAMQKTSSDGTANWTGTTTIILAIAPNFDIYGY